MPKVIPQFKKQKDGMVIEEVTTTEQRVIDPSGLEQDRERLAKSKQALLDQADSIQGQIDRIDAILAAK